MVISRWDKYFLSGMAYLKLGKPSDGPVSRHLNRRVSSLVTTHIIVKTSLTPNQLTVLIFLFSMLAFPAYLSGLYWLGALIAQLGSMLDGCDGELARLKNMSTPQGAFYDSVLDRYVDIATTAALTARLALDYPQLAVTVWSAGLAAIAGALMTSYSWHLLKDMTGDLDVKWPSLLADSRDVRTLLISLASGLVYLDPLIPVAALAWTALTSHTKTIYRLLAVHKLQSTSQ